MSKRGGVEIWPMVPTGHALVGTNDAAPGQVAIALADMANKRWLVVHLTPQEARQRALALIEMAAAVEAEQACDSERVVYTPTCTRH